MIPSERSHLFTAAITHPGMSGKSNEDRYAITAHRLDNDGHTPSVFAIIADGVGGHKAGEIAAEIAVNTISHAIAVSDGDKPLETLETAIIHAGEAIQKKSTTDESQHGMGSTCACVWVIGERLYTASVGDSRIYLLRDGSIKQISVDHTWVQEALEHGIIKPEQVRNHPRSHIIRRYLGSKSPVIPDFRLKLSPNESDDEAVHNQGMQLLPGDLLLLCSDGLSDLVNDNEIKDAFQSKNISQTISTLAELANERGGHDNITLLALKVPAPNESPDASTRPTPLRKSSLMPWITCVLIVFLTVVVLLLGAASLWFFNNSETTPTPTSQQEMAIPADTFIVGSPEITATDTPIPSDTLFQPTLTPWPTNPPENLGTETSVPTQDG